MNLHLIRHQVGDAGKEPAKHCSTEGSFSWNLHLDIKVIPHTSHEKPTICRNTWIMESFELEETSEGHLSDFLFLHLILAGTQLNITEQLGISYFPSINFELAFLHVPSS